MKKNKQKKKVSKILKWVFIALLVIAIAVIVIYAGVTISAYFKGGKKAATFALTYNGKTYTEEASGIKLYSGDEIGVFILKGNGEYQVEITSNVNAENDFDFSVGSEPFKWSDTAGKKFTSGFKITQTKSGFTIEYTTLTEILSSAYPGRDISVDDKLCGKELFKLTATYGKESISLSFGLESDKINWQPL